MAGGYGAGDPPDPIPNSEVKTRCADGTAGATRWESTAPPAYLMTNARFDRMIGAGVWRFPRFPLASHCVRRELRGSRGDAEVAETRRIPVLSSAALPLRCSACVRLPFRGAVCVCGTEGHGIHTSEARKQGG